jgi:RNA polymerase sigma-70 factor (ECF subfamily)
MWARSHVKETAADRQAEESKAEDERADAFRGLADGELDYSYRLANAILDDPVESEDAVHDAVVTAWQKWAGLRDRAKFDSWFRMIVVNTCRNRLSRSARLEMTDISAQTGLTTPDGSGQVADRLLVGQALRRLKPDDRIVLALRYARDLKLEDAARLLGMPTATFYSRLRAAHQRLRIVLEDVEPKETER